MGGAALRAVGIAGHRVTVVASLAAWSLIRILTAVPITPGGLGVVELGLTGALVGAAATRNRWSRRSSPPACSP